MTAEVQALVRDSFTRVAKQAAPFHDRLFVLDPPLRPLFKGDMAEHGHKPMAMTSVAVAGLDKAETIVPAVQALGRQHVAYGVRPAHNDTLSAALPWTLEQGLGQALDPPVRVAWTDVYTALATVMKDAAV